MRICTFYNVAKGSVNMVKLLWTPLMVSLLIISALLGTAEGGAVLAEEGLTPLIIKCTLEDYPEVVYEKTSLHYPEAPITIIPSVSMVLSVAVDNGGNLWAGTENGLICRSAKDGSWQLFNSLNGLSFNRITALEAQGKNLWIGASPLMSMRSENGGLMRKGDGEKGFDHFGRREGLTCTWIDSMLSVDSILYLGTRNGISFFDTRGRRCIYDRQGIDVHLMFCDGVNLWVEAATNLQRSTEIYRYNLETKVSTPLSTRKIFGFDRLSSVAYDGKRLWMTGSRLSSGTQDMSRPRESFGYICEGLKVYEPQKGSFREVVLPADLYHQWLEVQMRGSRLWLFSDRGFGTLDGEEVTFHRAPSQAPVPLFADAGSSEKIWMAGSSGLMSLSGRKLTCYTFINSISDNYITSLARAHDALWAGTGKGFINRIEAHGEISKIYGPDKGLQCVAIEDIFLDNHDRLYALCTLGDEDHGAHRSILYRYDPGEDRWNPAPPFEGDRVSTCQAVSMRHFSLLERLKLETPEGRVLFLEDRKNSWLSTYGGGLVKMPKGSVNLK
jgi:hypothetical protein